MISLSSWWQGFFTAVGLYMIFLFGQVIGYYKSYSESYEYYGDDDDKYR